MKIVALKETARDERRVAITPETAKAFINDGYEVLIEKGAGINSLYEDEAYEKAGARFEKNKDKILKEADIILTLQALDTKDLIHIKESAMIVGLLSPYFNKEFLSLCAKQKIDCFAMEQIPRITKAQNMDVLSSQSTLAGIRAVIEAVYHYNKSLSMLMTAAGTLIPAKVLILGVGVAGLSAIATAKKLGAIVFASDIRKNTKEQVESLGGKFLFPENFSDMEDKSGYAKAISEDDEKKYSEFLKASIKDFDIIITTAQIPGKTAPVLVTKEMISLLKYGSIIVDMSINSGGNVEDSKKGEIVTTQGVQIIAPSNLAAQISHDASKLYAKNLYNFIRYFVKENELNFEDEIVKALCVVRSGEII